MIEQLTERDGIILATGGGVVLDEGKPLTFAHTGIRYLPGRTHRPAGGTHGPGSSNAPCCKPLIPKRSSSLWPTEREPLYNQQVADMVVKTDRAHRTARGQGNRAIESTQL